MPFQLLIIRLITIEPNSRTIREVRHYVRVDNINLFCCLTTKSLDVDRDVSIAYCKSSSGDGVDWLRHSNMYHGGLLQLVYFIFAQKY